MIDLIFNFIFVISNFIDSNYFFSFIVYFFILIIFFSFSLPGGPLILLGSGFFFGFIPGYIINILSVSLGSLIFIVFSKKIMKKIFLKYYNKYSNKITSYIKKSSFEYLVLIRLIIGPPLIFQNVCISLMGVSKVKILVSSIVGFTPIMLLFSYTGNYASNIFELKEFSFSKIFSFEILLILCILIFLIIFKIYQKK